MIEKESSLDILYIVHILICMLADTIDLFTFEWRKYI